MIEKEILKALQKRTIDAVAGSILPALPVKYLGILFTPPEDGKWLEVVQIPNNINNQFWDETKTYRGIFRIILHWPMDNKGFYDPLDLLASISQFFVKGTRMYTDAVNVQVYENPDLSNMVEEPPQSLFFMSVRYNCTEQSS